MCVITVQSFGMAEEVKANDPSSGFLASELPHVPDSSFRGNSGIIKAIEVMGVRYYGMMSCLVRTVCPG